MALSALLEVRRPCRDFGVDRLSALELDPLMGFENRVLAVDIIGRGGRAGRAMGVGDDFDHRGLIAARQGGGAGPGRDAPRPIGTPAFDDSAGGLLCPLPDTFGKVRRFSSSSSAGDRRSPQHAIGRHGAGQGRHGRDSGVFLRDLHRTRGGRPDMASPCVQQTRGCAPRLFS